ARLRYGSCTRGAPPHGTLQLLSGTHDRHPGERRGRTAPPVRMVRQGHARRAARAGVARDLRDVRGGHGAVPGGEPARPGRRGAGRAPLGDGRPGRRWSRPGVQRGGGSDRREEPRERDRALVLPRSRAVHPGSRVRRPVRGDGRHRERGAAALRVRLPLPRRRSPGGDRDVVRSRGAPWYAADPRTAV
ncbi:MAG: hypothetical protein AVDCRST_MAG68-4930, partial [uncultured Gemmatimonadetes bacterium]